MKKITFVIAAFSFAMMSHTDISAQGFLKKLKDKASAVADKAIDKKIDKATGMEPATDNTNTGSNEAIASTGGESSSTTHRSSSRPSNKTGEGLKNSTAPDVNQQISEAETAFTASNFSEARFSIQQALLGIEIQLGKQIIRSLPATVAGLPVDSTEDKVVSTQWGWSNLTIQRVYRKDDKEFNIMIGNNSAYSGYLNILFSGNMAQSNGETQNFKQVKVKGNKAVIKFADREGYTVLVQLGQSGMLTFQGINFVTEQEMMAAVNTIDIDGIKKMLGEK
jgi:hypothetical protein